LKAEIISGQIRCQSQKDDGQYGFPTRQNGSVSRKEDHGFGGISRRESPRATIRMFLVKGLQWRLSENTRTDQRTSDLPWCCRTNGKAIQGDFTRGTPEQPTVEKKRRRKSPDAATA
jgi:hypothetical protein